MKDYLLGLAFILVVVPIYVRLFKQFVYISIVIAMLSIGTIIVSIYTRLEPLDEIDYSRLRGQRFSYFKKSKWPHQLTKLRNREEVPEADKEIYPDNFLINETLNRIVILILRDFVESWFQKISSRQAFIVALRHEFGHIIKSLQTRLVEVDFASLLLHRLVPILNSHVEKVLAAHEAVNHAKLTKKLRNVNESDLLLANYNRGCLHPAIKLNSQNANTAVNTHLSQSLSRILPYVMDEKEYNSAPCQLIVLELLTACVLNPLCSLLSDSDFYNSIINDVLSKQMKERNNVKRLRSVLRRHSMNLSKASLTKGGASNFLEIKLTMESSKKDYETISRIVQSSQNKSELLKYKYYLLLQNENYIKLNPKYTEDESKVLQRYIKRCNEIIYIIDSKLGTISPTHEASKRAPTLPLFSNQKDAHTREIMRNFSLHEVLSSPKRLEYFTAYMQQRGDRQNLLSFWTTAETIRNPLEFNDSQTRSPTTNLDQEEEEEEESSDDETIFVDTDFLHSDEIKSIFLKYFNLPVMKIPPKIFYKVSEFIEGGCSSRLGYHRARKSILKLQDFEYSRMKSSDFVAFKHFDYAIKLIVDEAVNEDAVYTADEQSRENVRYDDSNDSSGESKVGLKRSSESYGDPLANYPESEDGSNYIDVNMSGKVSDKVVKAVEDALNEIMNDDVKAIGFKELDSSTNDKRNSRLVSEDIAKDLFGADDDNLFTNDNEEIAIRSTDESDGASESLEHSGIITALNDSASTNGENQASTTSPLNNEITAAAPGDLNLSGEIERLDVEIKRLQEQEFIIQTLLKKAEIINNVPELRLLRKSMISLQKELKLKSMQRDQYIVQDGENSLYKCSHVSITNNFSAKDNKGRSFIMYAIKVEKLDQENNKTISTWMVTRRFSQFYELHNYLRSRYPQVEDIEFPKRNVVVKFIQGSGLEERKCKLENYLRDLVKIEEICSDKVFRDFLSSETFDTTCDDAPNHTNEPLKKKNIDGSGTRLYNIVFSQALYPIQSMMNISQSSIDVTSQAKPEESDYAEGKEMNTELDISNDTEYDSSFSEKTDSMDIKEAETDSKVRDISFVKPLCDLIVTVFHLNSAASWIRGKAMVMLFQQLFGSTVEKMLRTNIDGKIKSEETVSQILLSLQSSLWPGGDFRKSKAPKTQQERERNRSQAKELLRLYLVDSASKVFGQNAANEAAMTIYTVLQNESLNQHLILSFLDEILECVFPETR